MDVNRITVMPDTRYVIWSFEHNAWWRPGRMGYTQWLVEAGQYSEAEAQEICVQANQYLPAGQLQETAVLLSDAQAAEAAARNRFK